MMGRLMGRRGGLYAVVGAVALLTYFVWWPWVQDIRTGRAQLEQLQWTHEQRERTVRQTQDHLAQEKQQLETQWDRLHSGMVVASSPTAAGTEFLRGLQEVAESAQVHVRSSGLSPVDASQNPVRLTAELRGEGQRESVYEFVYRLSQGPPSYHFHRVRLDRLPGADSVSFELVLGALGTSGDGDPQVDIDWATMNPVTFSLDASRALTLFGTSPPSPVMPEPVETPVTPERTYSSNWHVVGIVQGSGEAAAVLRHVDGAQRVVRAGEALGDERVLRVEATYVVLGREDARSVIRMPMEFIAPWEEEVGP